jgi:RNA polymerase sigma factor (sigma-70 family)
MVQVIKRKTPADVNIADRPAEFDKRVVAHIPMLRKLAERYCHRNEWDEVVQETVESALMAWEKFRPEGSFHRWLYWRFRGVTRQRGSDDGKRRALIREDPEGLAAARASTPARQEEIVFTTEVLRKLSRSREGRMLVRAASGETYGDIGRKRGIGGERVRQLCERAREKISKVAA